MTHLQRQRGAVTLATTLVVFAAALALATSVQFIGIGEVLMAYGTVRSEQAFQFADSCVDEALLRLKRDSGYTGGSLSEGDASCTIAVSGSGSTRTITSTATVGQQTRVIIVGVSISGTIVTVTSWAEDTI
jgi:hypothetical protein